MFTKHLLILLYFGVTCGQVERTTSELHLCHPPNQEVGKLCNSCLGVEKEVSVIESV